MTTFEEIEQTFKDNPKILTMKFWIDKSTRLRLVYSGYTIKKDSGYNYYVLNKERAIDLDTIQEITPTGLPQFARLTVGELK